MGHYVIAIYSVMKTKIPRSQCPHPHPQTSTEPCHSQVTPFTPSPPHFEHAASKPAALGEARRGEARDQSLKIPSLSEYKKRKLTDPRRKITGIEAGGMVAGGVGGGGTENR